MTDDAQLRAEAERLARVLWNKHGETFDMLTVEARAELIDEQIPIARELLELRAALTVAVDQLEKIGALTKQGRASRYARACADFLRAHVELKEEGA